ncbi:MAG: response regulator transcription factor [Leptolyngbyaceae bacterium]|nr:response regulator transcription factor [Leptolyngbyaceae bacterium]
MTDLMESVDGQESTSPQILLIQSDQPLSQQMALDLTEAGYLVTSIAKAEQGLEQAITMRPALIVVDRMLAGESGLDLCRGLRDRGVYVPILLLMSKDTVADRIACLEAGADDYFLKPYRADNFLNVLQIYLQPEHSGTEQLRFADLTLNLATRQATRQDRVIDLTMKEFELLKYLMENPREVLTREQILENVWGYDFMGESNVIEVYVRYLRLKIEQDGEKRLIQTVRGVGYVLRDT